MTTAEDGRMRGVRKLRGVSTADERGIVRKVLTSEVLLAAGIDLQVNEVLTTSNPLAGTVRGLHYQVAPHEETKTLWVTRGAVYDIVVDVRQQEPTYGTWMAFRLTAEDDTALHLPPGVAHGYQTLEPDTSLTYLMAGKYSPSHARTLRWDDATLAIPWPLPVSVMSSNDLLGSGWPPR